MSELASEVQRLIASEFDRRGWIYDLKVGRAISDEIERAGAVEAGALARLVPPRSLTRARIPRDDVQAAIAYALKDLIVEKSAPAGESSGMRLLFIAAGPMDEIRLRLDAEHRDIQQALWKSTGRAMTSMEAALAARPSDLIDVMNRFRPTVLHMAGHGSVTGVALEDASGNSVEVSTEDIAQLIAVADSPLRLVVLNSCHSAYQAKPIVRHADAAIGMTDSIGDDAARLFATQLYTSLADGVGLGRAFEQAKLRISLEGLDEDKTPKLFIRKGLKAEVIRFARHS